MGLPIMAAIQHMLLFLIMILMATWIVFIINNSFIPVNTLNYANKRDLRAKDWPVADFLKGGGDHFTQR